MVANPEIQKSKEESNAHYGHRARQRPSVEHYLFLYWLTTTHIFHGPAFIRGIFRLCAIKLSLFQRRYCRIWSFEIKG